MGEAMRVLLAIVGVVFLISLPASAFAVDCNAYCLKRCATANFKTKCQGDCVQICSAKQKK